MKWYDQLLTISYLLFNNWWRHDNNCYLFDVFIKMGHEKVAPTFGVNSIKFQEKGRQAVIAGREWGMHKLRKYKRTKPQEHDFLRSGWNLDPALQYLHSQTRPLYGLHYPGVYVLPYIGISDRGHSICRDMISISIIDCYHPALLVHWLKHKVS